MQSSIQSVHIIIIMETCINLPWRLQSTKISVQNFCYSLGKYNQRKFSKKICFTNWLTKSCQVNLHLNCITLNKGAKPLQNSSLVTPVKSIRYSYSRHNEDVHYSRLAIGFFQEEYKRQIPLCFNNPELEAFLFPDLFQMVADFMSTHITVWILKLKR